MTEYELIILLDKYNIRHQDWGKGKAKTFEHLLKEINSGEAKLVEKDNQLFRIVSVIVMDVYYINKGKKLKLIEEQQIYKDGRIVRRELKNSLLEKLIPNEDSLAGAKRALSEELGINLEVKLVDKGKSSEVIPGKSYPGLMNEGTLYTYVAYLTDQVFNPEGYKEVQEDKTSYFLWKNN